MRTVSVVLVAAALPMAAGCGPRGSMNPGASGTGAAQGNGGPVPVQAFAVTPTLDQLDLLFVVDDVNDAAEQAKLAAQASTFVRALQDLPGGTPDLHVAVVTSDLGLVTNAPIRCSAAGDAGAFQTGTGPSASCAQTPLPDGATYLAQNGDTRNFAGDLDAALGCLLPAGGIGCGFIQPLAAAARALGADGAPAPAANAGFLRPNARLGIILLANQDDCSAPLATQLFSLQTGQSSLAEPLGPLTTYRCNRYGHLCQGPDGTVDHPPLTPPPGATTATLTDCTDDDSGGELIPVRQLVQAIKSLKQDPDDQITVGAIVAPVAPYAVAWHPAGMANPQNPSELWPQVMHACGPAGGEGVNPAATQLTTDGSFGDPAVRIMRFVEGFQNHALGSVCDASYAGVVTGMAAILGAPPAPDCIDPSVPVGAGGQPACTVVRHQLTGTTEQKATLRNCGSDVGLSPCWRARAGEPACGGARALEIQDDTLQADTAVWYAVSCPLCPGSSRCP